MNFIIAAIAIVYLIICGFGLIKILLKDNIPFSFFGLIPLCFGAGLGILAVLSNLIMLLGLRLSFITLYLPLFLIFCYALSQIKIKKTYKINDLIQTIKGISVIEWFLISIVIFGAASVFLLSVDFPMHFWDSRAIWAAKAKMLYYSGTVYSSDFMDPNRIHAHFRYPLLFPVSQAFIYFGLGRVDDWAVMVLIGMFFPCLISFLFDITRIYLNDREKGLIAAALVSVLPLFFLSEGPAYSGFADTPLSMLYCLSFGVILLWKRNNDQGHLLLASFLTAFLLLTKNEGINLILLNLLLIVMPEKLKLSIQEIKSIIKNLIIVLTVVIVIIAPWLTLGHSIVSEKDINDITALNPTIIFANLTQLPTVISYTCNVLIGIQKNMLDKGFLWGGLWLIFIFSSIISIKYGATKSINMFIVILCNFIIISLGYIVMGGNAVEGMNANVFRLYCAITPIVAFQIVTTLKALEGK